MMDALWPNHQSPRGDEQAAADRPDEARAQGVRQLAPAGQLARGAGGEYWPII